MMARGWKTTAKAHDVETSSLRKWVAAYEVHGPDAADRADLIAYLKQVNETAQCERAASWHK